MDCRTRAATIGLSSSRIKIDSKICRLCLAKTITYCSIIDNGTASGMLESLTSIKINSNDEISTVMCLKCRLNLTLAYAIQQNMIKAEERFKNQPPLLIKQESDPLEVTQENQEIVKTKPAKDENVLNLSTYSCEICGRTFATRRLRNRHKYNHVRRKCPICSKEITATNLRTHINSHRQENQDTSSDFSCTICGRTFDSRVLRNRHKYTHTLRKCPICSKEMKAAYLRTHIDSHTSVPQICALCGASLKTKHNLRQHMFYLHGESRHKCDYCDRVFQKKTLRNAHHQQVHLKEAPCACNTCGKKFYSKRNLNLHQRRVHTDEPPFQCDLCGRKFRQQVLFKQHQRLIHNILEKTTCKCEVCGKGFASRLALYPHQKAHQRQKDV